MSQGKKSLTDRLRDWIRETTEILGELMGPKPQPVPVPVRPGRGKR